MYNNRNVFYNVLKEYRNQGINELRKKRIAE